MPGPTASAVAQVSFATVTHGASSITPSQSSSRWLLQISACVLLTVASESSQSPPGSPSPSVSRGAWRQLSVSSLHRSTVHAKSSAHVTTGPATQPWWTTQISAPLQ